MNSRLLKCGDSRLCVAYTLRHVHDLCLLIFLPTSFEFQKNQLCILVGPQFGLSSDSLIRQALFINLLIKQKVKKKLISILLPLPSAF